MQIRGFQVSIGGTYVLMDDVVTALRAYAQSLDSPEAGALVHEVASWLQEGANSSEMSEAPPVHYEPDRERTSLGLLHHEPLTRAVAGTEVHGAEEDDVTPDVDRIEVFPDPPDDPRPKWYARSIDTGGFIMKTTNGSFDFEWVVKNAEERWPDIPIHLLKNAGEDSKWVEDSTRGVFPSKGPPVRRLWAGVGG